MDVWSSLAGEYRPALNLTWCKLEFLVTEISFDHIARAYEKGS